MIVLDASTALSATLDDEANEAAEAVIRLLEREQGFVPAIWGLEVANALISAIRRGRIKERNLERLLSNFEELDLTTDATPHSRVFEVILPLAREYSLSTYDASYLELALRLGARLATMDRRLADAARSAGVDLAVEPRPLQG